MHHYDSNTFVVAVMFKCDKFILTSATEHCCWHWHYSNKVFSAKSSAGASGGAGGPWPLGEILASLATISLAYQ